MKSKVLLLAAAAILSVTASVCAMYFMLPAKRIAYVRSKDVLEKYRGMTEAQSIYQKKMEQMQSYYDSLYAKVDNDNLKQFQSSLEQKASDENKRLTDGVLNRVNEYIERYARENKYSLVLGVTMNGNILYGDKGIDITEAVIDGLNKEYIIK